MPWEPLPQSSGRDPSRISDSLDNLVKRMGGSSSLALATLFDSWAEMVGPALAAVSAPISMKGDTLTIGVTDPAWVTQVRFLEKEILAAVSQHVGDARLKHLEVRVRPGRG